jgi:catechol 2,3-dioxygenase-like lactoylglutathione lyase family enzyme
LIANLSISVSDLKRSAEFYDALLTPLGWRRQFDDGQAIGWGPRKPIFVITTRGMPQPGFGQICLGAIGIAAIKGAWEAVERQGGGVLKELGGTPRYGGGKYSAFVSDPDGYEIEITVASE